GCVSSRRERSIPARADGSQIRRLDGPHARSRRRKRHAFELVEGWHTNFLRSYWGGESSVQHPRRRRRTPLDFGECIGAGSPAERRYDHWWGKRKWSVSAASVKTKHDGGKTAQRSA